MELSTGNPRFTDTHIIRTLHYYGQKALTLSLNLNRFIRTPPLIRALSMTPSVYVLTRFDFKAFVTDSLLPDPSWKPNVCEIAFRYLAYHLTLLHLNNATNWKDFSTYTSIRMCVSAKCQGPINMKTRRTNYQRGRRSEEDNCWKKWKILCNPTLTAVI